MVYSILFKHLDNTLCGEQNKCMVKVIILYWRTWRKTQVNRKLCPCLGRENILRKVSCLQNNLKSQCIFNQNPALSLVEFTKLTLKFNYKTIGPRIVKKRIIRRVGFKAETRYLKIKTRECKGGFNCTCNI